MSRFAVAFDTLDSDVETLARAVARSHAVLLVSDVRSPRVESLQGEIGADLLVGTHRMVDAGRGLRPSDAELATQVMRNHNASALDGIVYAGDGLVDLSWHEPELRSIPRGRLLNGLASSPERVLGSAREYVELGPSVIGLLGDAATSDFVISCRQSVALPEWLDITHLAAADPVWEEKDATVIDVRGLDEGETIVEVGDRAVTESGLLVVVGTTYQQGTVIQEFLPAPVAGRVIYCVSSEPWATELIGGGGHAPAESLGEALESFRPERRSLPETRVVEVRDFDGLRSLLREMITTGSDEVLVAVTAEGQPGYVSGERALLADFGFVAGASAPMGDLDPGLLRDDIVSIGPRARHVASIAAENSPDFSTFLFRLMEPSLTTSGIVGLVPGEVPLRPLRLRTTRSPLDLGLRVSPPFLPLPNAPAEPHPVIPDPLDPKAWVGRLQWGTRARLALPWRWQILPKAMRGRW